MSGDYRQEFEYAVCAIEDYRSGAAERQRLAGGADQGLRTQVTSGGHLDALVECIAHVFIDAGIDPSNIYTKRATVELPGFFRPEKSWDIIIMHEGELVAAIELKSIWSSYGNNMNNRTEEAVGSGFDFRNANEHGLYGNSSPWLAYVFVIKDSEEIHRPTRFREPHFKVDAAFDGTDYLHRSIITCRRLMAERVYDRVCYALADSEAGSISEPASDMTWAKFVAAIKGKVAEVMA